MPPEGRISALSFVDDIPNAGKSNVVGVPVVAAGGDAEMTASVQRIQCGKILASYARLGGVGTVVPVVNVYRIVVGKNRRPVFAVFKTFAGADVNAYVVAVYFYFYVQPVGAVLYPRLVVGPRIAARRGVEGLFVAGKRYERA